ncbi:hypothetical protein C8Q78DRAFT_1111521, partial [Trametes maxima]
RPRTISCSTNCTTPKHKLLRERTRSSSRHRNTCSRSGMPPTRPRPSASAPPFRTLTVSASGSWGRPCSRLGRTSTAGASSERWEDPAFRACFGRILEGGDAWRRHDPFDVSPRLDANQDLYNASNQCSIFRPWQGWMALSSTGAGEGTLHVLPSLSLAMAYLILRPFFRLRTDLAAGVTTPSDIPLDADAWVLDLENTAFLGSTPGKTQAITPESHPHLRIEETIVSIPHVEPGDQVYWHTDVIHAVERDHNGVGDSSVLYIPAAPLTERNAAYL